MTLYLRHKEHGEILDYVELLAEHPKLEVISEEQAYPERFVNKELAAAAVLRRGKRTPLSLETEEIPESPVYDAGPEVGAEAARGFGRGTGGLTVGPALTNKAF